MPALEGLRAELVRILSAAHKPGTVTAYNNYLARFVTVCGKLGLRSWRDASTAHVLVFLWTIARGLSRPSSSLDVAISALRLAFEALPTESPLDSPLISRMRKGLVASFTTRPRKPTEPLPVAPIRDWLRTLPANEALSVDALRMKCLTLAALVLIARPSDLCRIDAPLLEFDHPDRLQWVQVSLLGFKNDYHADGAILRVEACSEPALCFVRCCHRLWNLVRTRFPRSPSLFIDWASGCKLSPAQVGVILKEACRHANLPPVFSARNFRPGGATRGMEGGLPLDLVMHIGRWKNMDTVYNHYLRSRRNNFNVTDVLLDVTASGPGPALEHT